MAESYRQARTRGLPKVDWDANGSGLRCLVRWPGKRPALSQVLPTFDQLGLRLADHRPEAAADAFFFQRFEDSYADEVMPLLTEAFIASWEGSVDRDVFASLVVDAQLHPRQVQLVRAAFQYLRQAGLAASRSYVRGILTRHRDFVRHWVEVFEQRFDPDRPTRAEHLLGKYADAATTRDEFRVLDWYTGLLESVTRTNYFRRDDVGALSATIVLKLDPGKLPFRTDPAVKVETFVHHPGVEGIHVRYGAVARGGLRWSDRIEDYRDEVLALAKSQQVKNSLIVPAGAKGAFVVKTALAELTAAAAADEVRRCYRIFVRGLLDVTDDLTAGRGITRPPGVLATDYADPYLVVAADKGTAAFSDLANAEARDAGYWLDDAFASGGSTGFNHKALGVTARGAWVAVRRHLVELGLDPERDEITVVGIGDMSGDVFGNGMLLSDKLRLVAAFDHRDVFLDPDPDPGASFAERTRLAALPGSSWADYDPSAISAGGGVFPRSGRSVPISAPAKAALGIDADTLFPDELVQAVLRAPADLLWNGGIGTYVRASYETDAEVADRGNDRVRVTADELRCRVVGEGGNLGLTQAARVEFSLAGGRVNADFIDNAAGVNTSDREVNLKIMLRAAEDAGLIGRAERDRVLDACASAVVSAVLDDCEQQALAISVAEGYGVTVLDRHDQVIHNLEEHGLVRGREHLPDAEEIERRRASGRGLTRPEIAVILAHAKNLTHGLLLEGDVPDDDGVAGVLTGYFPAELRGRYAAQISAHKLGRDIIATRLTNELIDRVGPGFIYRIEDRTGTSTEQTIRAILIVRELLGLDQLWDGLAPYPVAPTIPIRRALERVLDYNASWLVRRKSTLGSIDDEVASFADAVTDLHNALAASPSPDVGSAYADALDHLGSLGAAQDLLTRCRAVARMGAALALSSASAESGLDVVRLERVYAAIGETVGLSWLYAAIPSSTADPHWVQLAKAALRDELAALTVTLATDVLRAGGLESWTELHGDALARARTAYAGLSGSAEVDVAMLTVGVQVLRDLCHAVGA
ncbi:MULTISPECIES: NAD-glutamate dehydrogenase domain-containing protein [unclassified Kribbella]|uniref:NAD-glutamate dehydrogenase domain-containing protein n=1 Tax=unclassified Kribbella TaxID=2644121 RepID=UPI0033CCE28A